MENLKSVNILMKNIVISQNGGGKSNTVGIPPNTDERSTLDAQLQYFHSLIQKTLLAVQKYKQLDIIGANELNQATHNLEKKYVEISNCISLLKNKTNFPKIKTKIETLRNDINNLFKLYGTENIHDLLNMVFGDNYSSSVQWDDGKYSILENYFHPINFKLLSWKSDRPSPAKKFLETSNEILM